METKSAVKAVLDTKNLSKYRLAKELGMASSTSVNQWLRGTKMCQATASKFESLYGIKISDAYDSLPASD